MRIVDNWQQASKEVETLLSSDNPTFLSRIGGSDTNAIAKYLALKENRTLSPEHVGLLWHKKRTAEYNGFYDKNNNTETFFRYCEELLTCYKNCTNLFMCNSQLLSIYFPTIINKEFFLREIENRGDLRTLIAYIAQDSPKTFYFYQLIESVISNPWTLFSLFSNSLINKKVLVISPFSESIRRNFHNRGAFFKNYSYPEFQLLTVDAPITYSGLPIELYPHSDWFETLYSLQTEISKIDFDIALLSCGSYAMPLGVYADRILQKKSVYVGGVLQLHFGIMGRRYEGTFVGEQINIDKFIYPLEREKYMKYAKLGENAAKEAFGAYF
jgi:hypothetical protein